MVLSMVAPCCFFCLGTFLVVWITWLAVSSCYIYFFFFFDNNATKVNGGCAHEAYKSIDTCLQSANYYLAISYVLYLMKF